MYRHLSPLAEVLSVSITLVHKLLKRETSVHKYAYKKTGDEAHAMLDSFCCSPMLPINPDSKKFCQNTISRYQLK